MGRARSQRMQAMLRDFEAEVESEIRDIQVRYRHAADDAAFSLQALENGEGEGLARKVDVASRAVGQYSRCAARLQQQLVFVRGLRQQLDAFLKGRGN
jgi:hypothetical protein